MVKRFGYLIALLPFLATLTQAQFSITGEIRPRAEYRDGYKILTREGNVPALFISQRSRLGVEYRHQRLHSRFIIQDVRVWGDETLYSSTGIKGDHASVDVHEAWLEYAFSDHWMVRLGRQVFKYDDQRLLAARNWNQYGLSYDASLIRYHNEKTQLDIGLSLNNDQENVTDNVYSAAKMKTLNFIRLQKQLGSNLSGSLLGIGSGYTASDTGEVIYMRGTGGGTMVYDAPNTQVRAAIYYQFGKNKIGQDVSAYFFSLDGSRHLNLFTLGGGINYISGQDNTSEDPDYQANDHLFDILYGARHGFYGHLDYFSNIPESTGKGGLVDIYARLEMEPSAAFALRFDVHSFALQNSVLPTSSTPGSGLKALDKRLGTELDLAFTFRINPELDLQGGYAFMLPTESLEILQEMVAGESDFSHWAWLMLSFKATIFEQQKNR